MPTRAQVCTWMATVGLWRHLWLPAKAEPSAKSWS